VKNFSFNLEAIAPLAIRSDHAPGGAASTPYISGTTLMGSLATVHCLYHFDDTEHFEKLFLTGQVLYPDLYPATFKNKGMQDAHNLPVYPLPKTAQTCKRFPGFLPLEDEEVDDPRHGVRDSLFDWAMFKLGSEPDNALTIEQLLIPLHEHKS